MFIDCSLRHQSLSSSNNYYFEVLRETTVGDRE